jgi:hypothetical protein
MRKSSIAISIAAVFAAPALLTAGDARTAPRQTSSGQHQARAHFNTPTDVVLYDQSGSADNGAPTQYSVSSSYDADGADDFVVTDANGWSVTQFNFQISVQDNTGPQPLPSGATFDVVVYPALASGTGPDVANAVCSGTGLAGTTTGTPITGVSVPLGTPCNLPQGNYWVSFHTNFDFPPQLFWENSAGTAIGSEAQWRNPGDAFGTGCTSFAAVSTCIGGDPPSPIGGGNPNFLFQIVGAVNGGGGGGCTGGGICLTVGLAPADPTNPDLCGTATTLDVTAGDQVNYCYTVTNDSGLELDYQSLSDNIDGSILALVNESLPAGGTLQYNRTATVSTTQTITSTWTSQNALPGYTSATGNLVPGTPDECADRIFGDGFDGTTLPCDSGTPGDFIDVHTTGTALNTADDTSAAATLPFSFNLYGQSSNQICVGNNGYILFGTSTCPTSGFVVNEALPSTAFSTAALLPYWDDLYTGGNIYTATLGSTPNRRFVVEWYQKNHYDSGASDPGGVTFEVVFGEDGTLAYNYLKTTFESDPSWDNGASATIGLQKDTTLANQFSSDQASVHALFYIDWTASAPTIFSDTDGGVTVNVGVPQIELNPTSLSGTAAVGGATTTTLNIGNIGTRDLVWSLQEASAAHLPPLGSRYALPIGALNPATALLKQRPASGDMKKAASKTKTTVTPFGGVPAFAVDQFDDDYLSLDASAPGTLDHIGVSGGSVASIWGGGFVNGDFATEYLIGDVGFEKINTTTGAVTMINAATGGGDVWAGTVDPTSGSMYYVGPSAAQQLSRIDDLGTGTAVTVGSITGSASGDIINAIAIDLDGHMWGIDKTQDTLVAIDKATGATSLVGSIGFDTEFIASLAFDQASGTLYLASPDNTTGLNNMYTVNTTSGAATLIAPIGEGIQLESLAIATAGISGPCATPTDVPWLALAPSSGTTAPSGNTPVTATLSAGALAPDTYHANVCVSSNDPVNNLIAVPVDFTVTAGGQVAPTLAKAFAPASVNTGMASTLTITLGNTNATAATLTAALTDTFPSGLVVAATPNAATTCPGGTVNAAAGDGFVTLSGSGTVQIPANGSCTLTVNVSSATAGSYANSIPAGALITNAGSNQTSADATLTVTTAGPLVCSGPLNHAIGNDTNGSSINWISGSIVDADPSSGYDINLYNSSGLTMWWNDAPAINAGVAASTSSSNYSVLTNGATIGSSSIWSRTNGAMNAFRAGVNGYLGFRFDCSSIGGTTCYGYLHLTTTATTGFPATIADYCYDNSGAAITIPGTPPPIAPTLAKAFAPSSVAIGASSTVTLTLANANATADTLSAALTDTLPSGLVVATPANAATTCPGGSVSASSGAGSFALASGAQIPANGSCTVTVSVSSAAPGSYVNTLAAGALQTDAGNNAAAASASLTVNPAVLASCPAENFDGATAPALPPGWVFSSGTGAGTFTTVSTVSDSAPNSAFTQNLATINDARLDSPVFAPTIGTALSFRNRYNLESGFDGAVLEISVNGGAFQDIVSAGGSFIAGGYNGTLSTNATFGNPLVGRPAWTGSTTNAFVTSTVAFPPASIGQPTQLRFRTGDDDSTTASGTSGWWIDTVTCGAAPPSLTKAFAPSNAAVGATSTLTISLGHPAGTATLSAALVDTFPAGLVVAAAPNTSTTCPAGSVTAAAGGNSVSLSSGAQIPVAGCNVKVDVTTAAPGIYVNTIAAGALQTDVGNNSAAASANFQATQAGFVTYSTGFEAPTFNVANLGTQGGWGVSGTASDWQIVTANPHAGTQNLRATWTSNGSGQTVAISPTQAAGTTAYSVANAYLSIAPSSTGNGTPFDFAPQDTGAALVITRVRFNNDAAKNIQVLDPASTSYVNTGTTWSPNTYYGLSIVTKRADSSIELCLNGTSIFSGQGFAPNLRNLAIIGTKGSGTANNVLSVDDVTLDNTNTGGCSGGPPPQNPPTMTKAFAPASVVTGSPSTLTITLSNSNATAATLSSALTDTFPSGLVVASAANASTTCGGTLTANAGDGSVSLGAAGSTIPANGSCTITVDTQSAAPGVYANSIAAGALQTSAGNNATSADATLTVTAPALVAPTLSTSFAPNTHVAAGSPATLTITLANSNASAVTLSAALNDTLPTNLVVATTPNAATTCPGGTVAPMPADTSFSLSSGAQIPANASCTVTVDVQSATAGAYTNTIAAGALQTNAGSNATAASDNVVVAGTFPTPYCSKTFIGAVQPITSVVFTGISNTSVATVGSTAMDNFLAVPGGLVGQTGYYPITVKANTDGNFTDFIRVYFDWNHDGVFSEDASERYEVGSITNSTGTDAKFTSSGVFVPASARSGLTRMRVVHDYGSAAAVSACDSTSVGQYGQTEDYLVTVDPTAPLPPAPPFVAKAFSPNYIAAGAGGVSTLTVTLTNYNATALPLTADLTDTFPTGLIVAPTANASTTCAGSPAVVATAGGTSLVLGTGASIPALGTCSVQVDVTTATGGIYVNTIAAGAAQSANGNSPTAASATLQFASATPTYSTGFESPFTAATVNGQQGWFSGASTGSTTTDWKVATTHPAAGTQQLRATWTSAGSSTAYSFALSPDFASGTSQYSSTTAKLAITTAGTGATFDFAPQDDDAGSVITRVRFLKSGTAGGTSGKIQVLDPNAVSADGYTDTGATWTGSSTANSSVYFTLQVVSDRSAGTFAVCVNGTSIWAGEGFGASINDIAILGNKGSGSQNNALDVDDLVIDNLNSAGGCTPPPAMTATSTHDVAAHPAMAQAARALARPYAAATPRD